MSAALWQQVGDAMFAARIAGATTKEGVRSVPAPAQKPTVNRQEIASNQQRLALNRLPPNQRRSFGDIASHPQSPSMRFRDDALSQGTNAVADPTQSAVPAQTQPGQTQVPGTTPAKLNKVSSITAITSAAGAITGFPSFPGVPDLNSPGPVNDVKTGACENVQQIKFDLTGIAPNEVDLTRTKNGVAGPVGQTQPRTGLDGPSDPTKLRKDSFIAVADTPGIHQASAGFPLQYTVDFVLYAWDVVTKQVLGKATYTVNIVKQAQADPKPVNEFKNFSSTIF
jgi:hypothetical protein